MFGLLVAIHVTVSISLIIIVLLQAGKGADLGATFGTGASQSLFGAGGGSSFLGKLTAGAAIIFMITSISLAYLSGKGGTRSIMPSRVPVTKTAPPVRPEQGAPVQTQPAGPAQNGPGAPTPAPQQPVKK